jgi:hypothetical protein
MRRAQLKFGVFFLCLIKHQTVRQFVGPGGGEAVAGVAVRINSVLNEG